MPLFTNMGAKQFSSKNIQAELNNRWEHRLFPIWKIIWRQKLRKIVVAPKEKEMPCSSIYTLVRILHNAQEYCTSHGDKPAAVEEKTKLVSKWWPHRLPISGGTHYSASALSSAVLHPLVFFSLVQNASLRLFVWWWLCNCAGLSLPLKVTCIVFT